MLNWPLEGLLFDVENNALWWPEWGERPACAEQRSEIVRSIVSEAPRLVPLFGHRYIPGEPNESGNPVFSIYQSDVIYYGADLADYFSREFGGTRSQAAATYRHIPFWSDLVDRNC